MSGESEKNNEEFSVGRVGVPAGIRTETYRIKVRSVTARANLFGRHFQLSCIYVLMRGHAVAYLVEALCYKPKGRRFESR
jgi:hypothetical protein